MEIIGCVGNGDEVIVTGINVDVGIRVGEITAVGAAISVGRAVVCLAQDTRNINKTIQE